MVTKGLGLGGAERVFLQAARLLLREGCTFFLVNIDPRKEDLRDEVDRLGIPVLSLPFRTAFSPAGFLRCLRWAKGNDIDLIHAHLPMAGVFARIIGKLAGVPVVYTEHSTVGNYRLATRLANRLTYGMNTQTIAVSTAVQDAIGAAYGVSRLRRCRVIPNGIDIPIIEAGAKGPDIRTELGIPTGRHIFGTVASFRPVKRIDLLLRAFADVVAAGNDAILLLVGHGEILPALKELARELKVPDRIIFTGMQHDALRYLQAMDTFVLCSDWEGLPMTLLEAMTLSRPVIATRVGGVPEVVKEGMTGRLIPPDDKEVLAQTMGELLHDPDQRLRLGSGARSEMLLREGAGENAAAILEVYADLVMRSQRTIRWNMN